MLNSALRTRSVVGRTPGALGDLRGTPLAVPPVTRSAAPFACGEAVPPQEKLAEILCAARPRANETRLRVAGASAPGGGLFRPVYGATRRPQRPQPTSFPPLYRHSCVGRDPFRAQAPDPPLPTRGEDAANAAGEGAADGGANAPRLPCPPAPRHSRESGNLLPSPSPPACDKRPLRRPPPLPYAVPMTPALQPQREPTPPDGGGSIWPHFSSFRPQNAPFRPQFGLIARRTTGVNGAKWGQMEPLLQNRARSSRTRPD